MRHVDTFSSKTESANSWKRENKSGDHSGVALTAIFHFFWKFFFLLIAYIPSIKIPFIWFGDVAQLFLVSIRSLWVKMKNVKIRPS